MGTALQGSRIIQHLLQHCFRRISVNGGYLGAVNGNVRQSAPGRLQTIDNRIGTLKAEFHISLPCIAGAVVVMITARDGLMRPGGKLLQIGILVVPDHLVRNGSAVLAVVNLHLVKFNVPEELSFFAPATVSVTVCSP